MKMIKVGKVDFKAVKLPKGEFAGYLNINGLGVKKVYRAGLKQEKEHGEGRQVRG